MDVLGPLFYILFAIMYIIGCIVYAFILWLIYKFAIKSEERPGFWGLYKISFSSGLISGALSYALFKIAASTSVLGASSNNAADMAALSLVTQILSYPRATAAIYLVLILAILAALTYTGLYLAHRFHEKSTPKQTASKVSLIIAAVVFLMQGAFFAYAWIAISRGMEAAHSELSPEEAAAAEAGRKCAAQMQQALTLPPEEQQAAIYEASKCMMDAAEAGVSNSDGLTPSLPTGELAGVGADAEVPQLQSPQSSPQTANQPPAFLDRSVTIGEWKYYVILGSAPQGSGAAAERAGQLNRCLGYQPGTDFTYAFQGLAPDLEIVHLGGYSTVGEANRVAAWARDCAPDAYVKRAKFLFD